MTTSSVKKYNVGGVALDRPFKILRLGHFGFNAADLEASRRFYFDLLGFFITEPAGAGYFGRHAGDHHSFALFEKKKFNQRQYAGDNAKHFREENDINQITWQVQSVAEMAGATKYFMTSASRSCARGALVAAVRNFTSTSGRRTNKSSNFMASSRSAGTATPPSRHAPWL